MPSRRNCIRSLDRRSHRGRRAGTDRRARRAVFSASDAVGCGANGVGRWRRAIRFCRMTCEETEVAAAIGSRCRRRRGGRSVGSRALDASGWCSWSDVAVMGMDWLTCWFGVAVVCGWIDVVTGGWDGGSICRWSGNCWWQRCRPSVRVSGFVVGEKETNAWNIRAYILSLLKNDSRFACTIEEIALIATLTIIRIGMNDE